MPDASTVILADGPMAGHLQTVLPDTYTWCVRVPPAPRLVFAAGGLFPRDETAYYRIGECAYRSADDWFVPRVCRIGYTGPDFPDEAVLAEYVPTGLAEQGLWPWDQVPPTRLDWAEPVGILAVGDPEKDCALRYCDPWLGVIDATCGCGWYTDRLPLDRRSQIVRAAHLHEVDAPRRRSLLAEPIETLHPGRGRADDCYGGITVDKAPGPLYGTSGLVYGQCRQCGWLTEMVEAFRSGALQALLLAHRGADGVRQAQNRLRVSLGAPLLPDPRVKDEPALWGEHSDRRCAEPDDDWRCLAGTMYGPCGHENCYGVCEDTGRCPCRCHRSGREDTADA